MGLTGVGSGPGRVRVRGRSQGARDRYEATEVKNLLLHLAGLS